jgi:hypothetical protein
MARLQDFQTVTPTSSDKLLVVQSQGQGLVSWGSKLDSANPTGTGAFSLNRKSGTTTGNQSVVVGGDCTASAPYSVAMGDSSVASGNYAIAGGLTSTASGATSLAIGVSCEASGNRSQAVGSGTIANHKSQHVFGEYNTADGTASSAYRGNYIEIVGNGTADNARSNARTLDWSGNEVLAGSLKVNGNDEVVSTVYSNYQWGNSHTFKVSKPATYLLFTDSGTDMAKLKIFADNVATLYQMIGTTIQSVTLNASTMEVTVTVNNKGLCAIRLM